MEKTADEIIKYIKSKSDFGFFADDEPEMAIVKHYHFFVLKWCGCGDPLKADLVVGKFLEMLGELDLDKRKEIMQKEYGVKSIYDSDLLMCLAYTMDAAGLTEHGSSIGWAWLTEDGENFLWAIREAERKGILEY